MGLKKKIATKFTRKTNSRKDKRKEAEKREKTLKGSNVSLTVSDIYDQLYEEYENGKQSSVPHSENRILTQHGVKRKESDCSEVFTSELQIIPTREVPKTRPRTARILTCPGNMPPPRTHTRMLFRDNDTDVETISLCSSESGISLTSMHAGEGITSRVTMVAPFTPTLGKTFTNEITHVCF